MHVYYSITTINIVSGTRDDATQHAGREDLRPFAVSSKFSGTMTSQWPSNAELVRQHPVYAQQLGSLTAHRGSLAWSLEDEAFRVLEGDGERLDDHHTPEKWLKKRACTIATLIKEAANRDMTERVHAEFVRLVRDYVIVEHLNQTGPRPTLSWFREKSKIQANSKQWLQSSRHDQRRETREKQEQLKPRSERRLVSAPASTGFPVCEREGCGESTGDVADGKVRKTNFVVVEFESEKRMKVCRACIIQANSQAADPKAAEHIRRKDSLTVKLARDTFFIFSRMGMERKMGGGGRAGRLGKPIRPASDGNPCPTVSKKRKLTVKEMLETQSRVGSPAAGEGTNPRHEGTEADPILLSSSDDEEQPKNRKEKLYMAVVNPCQRQTRHTSKLDVETDPVLDKLKCFMPPEGGRGSIKFALRDYFKLRPMEFLNDSCIDYFMKGIDMRLKEELPSAWDRCYFFNSFFYKKLTDNQSVVISEETKALAGMPLGDMDQASLQALRCYDLTKSWTKNVDLFEKDYLFIPVCEKLHWSLLIVCHPGRGVVKGNTSDPKVPETFMMHLDSMRSASTHTIGKLIKMYLQNEWNAKLRQDGDSAAKRWVADHPGQERDFLQMTIKRPRVPLQDNHFDCGLFLCAYVDHFLAYLPKTMNERKVPKKPRMVNKLTRAMRQRCDFPRVPHFLTQKWFSSENVGNMRTDMALRAIKAMAVNAGVMDSHARWLTDKPLTQEQQHMMTYLMNQEEILKGRNESYVGPEWLEVMTDEEEGGYEEDVSNGEQMSEEIVVDIDEPACDGSHGASLGAQTQQGFRANASVAAADEVKFRRMQNLVVDELIEGTARDGSQHPQAMSPSECRNTLRKVHEKKRDRNTPSVQAITQRHRDGTVEVLDMPPPRRSVASSNPFHRPCTLSTPASSRSRGSSFVEHIRGKAKSDARKR